MVFARFSAFQTSIAGLMTLLLDAYFGTTTSLAITQFDTNHIVSRMRTNKQGWWNTKALKEFSFSEFTKVHEESSVQFRKILLRVKLNTIKELTRKTLQGFDLDGRISQPEEGILNIDVLMMVSNMNFFNCKTMPQSNVFTKRKNNFLVLALWDTLRFSPFVYDKREKQSGLELKKNQHVCQVSRM